MELDILQSYLNGLVSFFTSFELSTSINELNHHFVSIENIIQMLHIALNIYWNMHKNLMLQIYIWMD
jgi:hypothetical protein